jgi:hypothetical protein
MGALASVQQEYTKAGLPSCKRVTAAMASGGPHGNGSVPEVPLVSFRSARRVAELESVSDCPNSMCSWKRVTLTLECTETRHGFDRLVLYK